MYQWETDIDSTNQQVHTYSTPWPLGNLVVFLFFDTFEDNM